jgi:hypothetical protein
MPRLLFVNGNRRRNLPDPCHSSGGYIAAVMKSSEIHIWTEFSLGFIAIYEESSILETIVQCPMSISTPSYDPQATHAVIGLHIDSNPNSALSTFLAAYENDLILGVQQSRKPASFS